MGQSYHPPPVRQMMIWWLICFIINIKTTVVVTVWFQRLFHTMENTSSRRGKNNEFRRMSESVKTIFCQTLKVFNRTILLQSNTYFHRSRVQDGSRGNKVFISMHEILGWDDVLIPRFDIVTILGCRCDIASSIVILYYDLLPFFKMDMTSRYSSI